MKTRRIWLGIGTAILAAPPATAGRLPAPPGLASPSGPGVSGTRRDGRLVLAQHAGHAAPPAAGAPAGAAPAAVTAKPTGGGEGEGGGPADQNLAPILAFNRSLQLVRGHLLVGGELVEAGRWAEALPHFLHPSEEIYGRIRGELRTYDAPPFETALKALAQTVKARSKEAYARALATLNERLDAADRGVRAKQTGPWAPFVLETALETLRVAGDEYTNAIDGGRIKLAVEYQDSRGFVWQAERQIETVAAELGGKDAAALAAIRAALADLKAAWPGPMPPRAPVRSVGEVLSDISRVELQSSRLH